MTSPIVFYYMDVSAPSRAIWMVLELLGVKYEERYVNLINKDHKTNWYAEINPRQKVPAIEDNGLRLAESRAIATYLINQYGSETQKQQLYPPDLRERAVIDQHLYVGEHVFDEIMGHVNVGGVLLSNDLIRPEKTSNAKSALRIVEKLLEKHTYTATDHFSLADIFYYVAVHLLSLTDFNEWKEYPNVVSWTKKIQELPYYEKTCGEPVKNLRVAYKEALKKNANL
ncbi:glutathione S-transferase D7-like [Styela clava]